jgi:drug/metabolite transporter (DMT)-like permease
MSALALSLVLVAALIHASWNLVAKKAGGDVRFALMTSIAVAVLWTPVGLAFVWQEVGRYGALQWGLIVASGVIHVVYYVTLLRGYRLGDLTVVYPLARGTGPLITAVVATLLLGETLGLVGWAGVLGIVGGILLIAGGPALVHALRAGEHAQDHHRKLRAGVGYGVVTGLFIAAYSVVDGYAVKRAGLSPIAVDYLGNLVRIPVTALWVLALQRSEPLPLRGYWRPMLRPALILGAISPVSYVMVLYAVTMAPLSQVAPMREVSMLFAALLGGTLLGEKNLGSRLLGAACIAGGVIALALA